MNIVITGGVTGGHLFPAIAIADEFKKKDKKNKIVFVSIINAFEEKILSMRNYSFEKVNAPKLKGETKTGIILSLMKLPIAVFKALGLIKKLKPDLIIGVGSYASAPAVIAARLLGIDIVICEQNTVPGMTNRILSKFAKRVYLSFEDKEKKFDEKKVLLTGNPIIDRLSDRSGESDNIEYMPCNSDFVIAIVGGSQGASAINGSVIKTLKHLKDKNNIFFFHQTGEKDEQKVKKAYESEKVRGIVKPFFYEMNILYNNANLMITRAGATTIAEITAIGKAAIYIPFPYAADVHQEINAKMLEKAGAGEMIPEESLTEKTLAKRIEYYRNNPDILKRTEHNAKKFGKPEAVKNIVEDICRLFGK